MLTARFLWHKIIFFTAIAIELCLLFVILIILLIGILGIFLPIIPGLLLVGLAASIYSFIVKSGYGTVSMRIEPYVDRVEASMKKTAGKHMKKFLPWYAALKPVQRRKILQYGVLLFGINTLMTLVFIFSLLLVSLTLLFTHASVVATVLAPLGTLFIFAGCCAIVWFRFGQTVGSALHPASVLHTSMVVIVSLIPIFILYGVLIAFFTLLDPYGSLANFIMGALGLMTTFLALFEVFVVHLGASAKRAL